MDLDSNNVKSEQLGHLGLVAATIKRLGIIEKIDARLELDFNKGGIVSYGQRVSAMILNGLGFMNSRLCMTSHFFQDKPVANLLGDEITAENLNDDCLGRGLDKIAEYGVTKLYSEIAFEIASEHNLLGPRMHLDTTSFSLSGRYDEDVAEGAPKPTYGYSKDHRPDLKQVMLSLTQGGKANIPLWMETLDGNSSDQVSFHETVKRITAFTETLESSSDGLCFVVDAAFYVPKKISELDNVHWITRVPAKLKEATELLHKEIDVSDWLPFDEFYKAVSINTEVYGISQRWLLIESAHAKHREEKAFARRLDRTSQLLTKKLWHLGNQKFQCEKDAEKAIRKIIKSSKYHSIHYEIAPIKRYVVKGRPKADSEQEIVGYRIEATHASCLEKIKHKKKSLGRFILATNQLEAKVLSHHDVLKQYKQQSSVESGFKFIKDNAFELSSFYLKTPARIGALMMVMTLCLMVYNFAQYHMRKCIEEQGDVLPNQVGKPIKNPTMKWIAELMHMISVVTINTEQGPCRIITNVKKVHQRIIAYFGEDALKIYGLPPDLKTVKIDHLKYKNIIHWCEK